MRSRHLAFAIVAALLYAGCYAAIKAGLAYAPPFGFAALRSFIGGLMLLAVLAVTGQPWRPARALWVPIGLLAALGSVVGFSAMFYSPLHTGAGVASVLGNTGPLFMIVLAALFLGERITAGKLAALLLATGGIAFMALSGGSGGSWHPAALVLPLLAASSRAVETVLVKGLQLDRNATLVATWQFLLASIGLTALSVWLEPQARTVWTVRFALSVSVLAGGSTAAATALWYWLLQREEVSRLSLVLFLIPVAGLALGITLFGERVRLGQVAGMALILAGVVAAAVHRGGSAGNQSAAPGRAHT